MGDLTLQQVVLRIGATVLIAAVNGFAVAALACALGDPGPRHDERLTMNPLRHLDVVGGLLSVLFGFGWIRPIAVDPDRLRLGRAGLLAVVTGASCATIALAEGLLLTRPAMLNLLPDTAAATFFVFVETVCQLCVAFTLFNLLPLPPLAGQHWLVMAWPNGKETIRRAQPYAAVVLALLIIGGVVARLLTPADAILLHVLLPH